MGQFTAYYKARKEIENILRDDLEGPVFDDELLDELPTQYYVMGKLYPQKDDSVIESNTQSDYTLFDEASSLLSMSSEWQPSAMGMTFILKKEIRNFQIRVDFARYEMMAEETTENHTDHKWKRNPCHYEYSVSVPQEKKVENISLSEGDTELARLSIYCHHVLSGGEKIFTISLVNMQASGKKKL